MLTLALHKQPNVAVRLALQPNVATRFSVIYMYWIDYMSEEKRSRWFNLLLYPDNPQHNLAIMQLQTTKYMACGICHNMDCYESDSETH